MAPRPPQSPTSTELVELALALLEQGGPEAVTLRSVGDAAGVSTQVLYSRFGSKAELLAAMAAAGLHRLDRSLAQVPHAAGREPDPADLARAYQRFARAHPALYDLLFSGQVDKHNHPAVATAGTQVLERFLASVAPHHPDPEDARRVVELAWAGLHGVISLERSGHLRDPGGELVSQLADALLARPSPVA